MFMHILTIRNGSVYFSSQITLYEPPLDASRKNHEGLPDFYG